MPAPGEQHNSGSKIITNPFEEVKPRISEYTAQEIATLQSRLEKQLGPEYISSRSGPSGQKVHYIAAEKCIQLANEVFGFNGWSSQIMDVQVDFVDENPQTLKVSLGLSVIVRVTLRDGTFHEDVGYGHMENSKGKAAAFEKAKKEGATDALKRALRNFGNVLGNCLYDKEYLKQVTKVKAQPTRWNVDNLHRHSTFEPVKRETQSKPPAQEEKPQNGACPPSLPSEDTFEDEFGDFDEADFGAADPDSHPDEVVLQEPSVASSRHFSGIRNGSAPNGGNQNQNRPPNNRPPINRPSNAIQPQTSSNNQPQQPQTPNSGFTRANNGAAQTMRPPPDARPMPAPALNPRTGQRLNQPSRNGPPSAPGSPLRPPVSSNGDDDVPSLPPLGKGFFSARAATMIPQSEITNPDAPPQPIALPLELAFNPHAESPSIRKTPGVDHKSSRPVRVEMQPQFGSQVAPVAGAAPRVPGAILNPTLDSMRRIGAPTSPSMVGRGTGAYKPPTMKRPGDTIGGNAARIPLNEMPANGAIPGDGGGDQKRQRLSG